MKGTRVKYKRMNFVQPSTEVLYSPVQKSLSTSLIISLGSFVRINRWKGIFVKEPNYLLQQRRLVLPEVFVFSYFVYLCRIISLDDLYVHFLQTWVLFSEIRCHLWKCDINQNKSLLFSDFPVSCFSFLLTAAARRPAGRLGPGAWWRLWGILSTLHCALS